METTTAAKLSKGARVMVTGAPAPFVTLAKAAEGATAATVTADPTKDGRKLVFATTEGVLTAGPTARVLLAPDAAPEAAQGPEEAPEETLPPPAGLATARVDVDAAGRLMKGSVVRVGDRAAPVPLTTERGGIVAPIRLAEALASIGFEPVTRWTPVEDADAVACQVRPAH
ncbi:hypothetical protein DER29_0516 [Micromonospora sp. M71_S20]|uniref:hypothetical protein n=1 Tax=Micromonospora sp. M71_S20 TaxID=592872 RepID=UPI000EAF35CE|nr:hypothetical protein [Micromonospora sp. M71_S20]RLK22677.1 hypothetical protein DER29_0516 [Micromonospora sp. M71_S20]